jgi:hypothetical protein
MSNTLRRLAVTPNRQEQMFLRRPVLGFHHGTQLFIQDMFQYLTFRQNTLKGTAPITIAERFKHYLRWI